MKLLGYLKNYLPLNSDLKEEIEQKEDYCKEKKMIILSKSIAESDKKVTNNYITFLKRGYTTIRLDNYTIYFFSPSIKSNGKSHLDHIHYNIISEKEKKKMYIIDIVVIKENNGIGSILLEELFSQARKEWITEISGDIVVTDARQKNKLVYFYKKHGFEILEPDEKSISGTTNKIYKKLI